VSIGVRLHNINMCLTVQVVVKVLVEGGVLAMALGGVHVKYQMQFQI
jgi:hypothetical protein